MFKNVKCVPTIPGLPYVALCNQTTHYVIDIRKFVGGNSTIIGIKLNEKQWLNLSHAIREIKDVIYA